MNPTHQGPQNLGPQQLGPYTIQSRLGRGGMGAVYEAFDTTTGKIVAVKVLASHLADDHGLRQRFEAEIEALKNLRHPGIVRLIAFGEQDDQPFFAMELVRGKSLEQILRAGRRFTWRETSAIAIEITRALKAAHDQGIVHRDLKPANLLVIEPPPAATAAPAEPADADQAAATAADRITIKLADFGIAKLFGGAGHTALGHVVGTAEYMAPEQAAGRPVDHRVDLYALGLVMYAMLTGGPPFRGTQLTEVIHKQQRAIPPRVKSLVADVPEEFDELIARLLSKDPAQRPASALALGRLLTAIETLHPPTEESIPSPPPAAPRAGGVQPTALDRSKKPTQLDELMAATGPAIVPEKPKPAAKASGGPDIDQLAPTRALPVPSAADSPPSAQRQRPTAGSTAVTQDLTGKSNAATGASAAAAPSRLSTDVASATTFVERGPANRFTTVEEFERTSAARERQEQRRQLVWQGLTTAVILSAVAWVGWLLVRSPSADTLYERIAAVADAPEGDLRDARDDIARFLDKHASDPRAGRVREVKRMLDLDTLERRARRRLRGDKELSPLERDYRAAMNDEENGPSACVKALEAMLAVYAGKAATAETGDADDAGLWLDLARRQLERLRPRAEAEQRDDAKRIGELLAEAQSLAARAGIANDDAARKKFAAQRRRILENIVEVYAERPHAAEAVAFARRELDDDADAPKTSPPSPASTPATGPSPGPSPGTE